MFCGWLLLALEECSRAWEKLGDTSACLKLRIRSEMIADGIASRLWWDEQEIYTAWNRGRQSALRAVTAGRSAARGNANAPRGRHAQARGGPAPAPRGLRAVDLARCLPHSAAARRTRRARVARGAPRSVVAARALLGAPGARARRPPRRRARRADPARRARARARIPRRLRGPPGRAGGQRADDASGWPLLALEMRGIERASGVGCALPWVSTSAASSRHVLDFAMRGMNPLRADVLAPASGEVLEVGFGTGLNLRHYPRDGDAPSRARPDGRARRSASRSGSRRRPSPSSGTALRADGRLPFDDAPLRLRDGDLDALHDSRPGRRAARDAPRAQARRALLFIEHGRSDEPKVARFQDRWNPIQNAIARRLQREPQDRRADPRRRLRVREARALSGADGPRFLTGDVPRRSRARRPCRD